MKINKLLFAILLFALLWNCGKVNRSVEVGEVSHAAQPAPDTTVYPGIYSMSEYLQLVDTQSVAVVTNQTGVIDGVNLVDTLLALRRHVVKVFCPEHGFRGTADAGAAVNDTVDSSTGLPVISLYGKNKKPSAEQFADVDIVLFDLQDVGVRFYTYLSTLHYVMATCAETGVPLVVLDRPNPNAHIVDGPILDTARFRSFVGMHPVPILYGLTIGEYACMINGEHWLGDSLVCDLTVVKCRNYNHRRHYRLPVKPSPNLPNDRAVELYPSLCLFEGTTLSVGRGTDKQFQVLGHPDLANVAVADFRFTPQPNQGSTNPVLNGIQCAGFDLSDNNSIFAWNDNRLNINILLDVYRLFPDKGHFFAKTRMFDLLSGSDRLKQQLVDGATEQQIRASWQHDLDNFKNIREKYLLYDD